MTVSVIVPWRPNPERRRARDFVIGHVLDVLEPDEVVLANDPGDPFNRGRALNAGVASVGPEVEVLVFADADLWVPAEALKAAVELAHGGGGGYVMPFNRMRFLDPYGTEVVLAGNGPPDIVASDDHYVEMVWDRPSTGGCNIIRRDHFEQAYGFDHRFAGWGYEDAAFDIAVSRLVGPAVYLDHEAVHLWHPHAPDRGTDITNAGLALCQRYEAAALEPTGAELLALIAERSR